jgi:hypothetical protein
MRSSFYGKTRAILGFAVAASLVTACGNPAADQGATAKAAPETSAPAPSQATTDTSAAAPVASPSAAPAAATPAANPPVSGVPCPSSPKCEGTHCSSQPFVKTDCWTTQYGPAEADVVSGNPVNSPNMLYCNGGTYALCFFSGPPNATGSHPGSNNPLPCVLHGDVANCTCQAYPSGPYYVDINGILNRGAYLETVSACGPDGSGCQNISVCGKNPNAAGCTALKPAPVCASVKNQSPSNPAGSLMPKADLDSTFSFAMTDYPLNPHPSDCSGLYAGCMTAPCFFKKGHTTTTQGETVQCECPTYTGTYQVGETGQTCSIPGSNGNTYVWSAARTVSSTAPVAGKVGQ